MDNVSIEIIGQKSAYTECQVCHDVANRKPTIETGEITRFEKLIKIQIAGGSHFLCRGCKQKLTELLNQY